VDQKIGIFYGSTTGNTRLVVDNISFRLADKGVACEVLPVAQQGIAAIEDFANIILASPTWYDGRLQDDWQEHFKEFEKKDFSGKRVAILGLGDQVGFPDCFVDAIGIMAGPVRANGGQLVGQWPAIGYRFETSRGIEDGHFLGLAIDQDNQIHETDNRLSRWLDDLEQTFY